MIVGVVIEVGGGFKEVVIVGVVIVVGSKGQGLVNVLCGGQSNATGKAIEYEKEVRSHYSFSIITML